MALFGTGSTGKYWKLAGQGIKPKSFGPFTVLTWFNAAIATNLIYGLTFGVDATAADNTGGHTSLFQFNGTWRFGVGDGTNTAYASQVSGTTTAGQWFAAVGVVESFSGGTCTIYQGKNADVSSGINSGTFAVDSTWTDFSVHASTGNGITSSSSDLTAEVAVWNRVLGKDDAKRLLSGVNPLSIRGNAPLHYWPLIGDLRNLGRSGAGLTPVGSPTTKFGPHPPVAPPPLRGLHMPFSRAISVASFRKPLVSICT